MPENIESTVEAEVNIIETVKETINSLCDSLFTSINNNVFPLLDDIVFVDTDITDSSYMEKLFNSSATSGIIILANCLLTAFILYYAIRLMMSHFVGSHVDAPYKFFIKTIFIAIFMNFSLELCSAFINIAFNASSFFCALGKEIIGKEISFITFTSEFEKILNNNLDIFSLDGILCSTLYISSFNLAITYALRYIFIKVLILLSPFVILCLTNQSTEFIFKNWLKCFFSLLFLQVIVSIILLLPFIIVKESSNMLFNKLLLIGSISALLKANQFIREFIGGIDVNATLPSAISNIKSMLIK